MAQWVKKSAHNPGDPSSIPESGRSHGEGNSNPFQYSCLENTMDRGVWQATVHGVAESDTTEQFTVSLPSCVFQANCFTRMSSGPSPLVTYISKSCSKED